MKRAVAVLTVGIMLFTQGCCSLLCQTKPAPGATPGWEPRIIRETVSVNGQPFEQVWIAVPQSEFERMVDRLIYLKELEKQGRIRED